MASPVLQEPAAGVGSTPAAPHSTSWLMWMLEGIPNLIAFAMLGGIFWLGHHYEWKLPKLSELMGEQVAAPAAWCEPHSVLDDECVECKPDLMPKPKPKGFCNLHGVGECVICNPTLAQSDKATSPKYDTGAAIAVQPRNFNNSRSMLVGQRVQYPSKEAFDRAGVLTELVVELPMSEWIAVNAEAEFDPTRVAHLGAKTAGVLALTLKKSGDPVKAGDTLALLDAAAVGQAKSQLAAAIVQRRTRQAQRDRLAEAGTAIPGKALAEAKAALDEAEVAVVSASQSLINFGFVVPDGLDGLSPTQLADALRFLGISDNDLGLLPRGVRTANLIPITSPFAGIVQEAEAVAGEVVDPTKPLFTIVDPDRLYLKLAVPEEQVRFIRIGQTTQFTAEDRSEPITAKIEWIGKSVDKRTRTVEIRAAVKDAAGRLRQGRFGTARIILRDEPHAIVVPKEAIQGTADGQFVFVRDKRWFESSAPKVFHARQVRIGARSDSHVELLAGVLPGEVIAAKGSTSLMAQLLKANLGAGCGCHH